MSQPERDSHNRSHHPPKDVKECSDKVSIDELSTLFKECEKIVQIKQKKQQIKKRIHDTIGQQVDEKSVLEEEIKIHEQRLVQINQEIKKCGKNMEIKKYRLNKQLVIRVPKNSVVIAENIRDELLENSFEDISGYENIVMYEDDMSFYILVRDRPVESVLCLEPVSLEHCDQSMGLFSLKIRLSHVLYNLILKKSNIVEALYDPVVKRYGLGCLNEETQPIKDTDPFHGENQPVNDTGLFHEEIRKFNDFFRNTGFHETDLNVLTVKILLNSLRDTVMEYKDMHTLKNINDSLVSFNVIKFVTILNMLNDYSRKDDLKTLILPNLDQAIKNFFNPNRSNSLYEKLVNFSDACYFVRNYKNKKTNITAFEDLQEIAFQNVYTTIEFNLQNQDDAENLRQITDVFSDKVDIVFQNHWKMSLKSFLLDKIYESFFEHISSLLSIKEYDAFELTAISKILVDLGIDKLNNFPKIFMTQQKGDCDITDEEFEMIIDKLDF